ncbi:MULTISPECIES: hypothetical protein [unclassified Legionella]|uniref:hypothetical protein n=1 Tax=Legionella sp. PC997 TaxID=2755562 RepID=UPI0015FB2505|nr:hypothetical protein [Legionella sp. PC997]QMT59422.1 hypothetical protein HBNCFIEN_00788 [Legionella sp. PC997]
MNQFKFLKIINYQLNTYELIAASIQNDIRHLQSKLISQQLSKDEANALELSQECLNLLIESTFLQMYSQLEAGLYLECRAYSIKKKASISRFEMALRELGYDVGGVYWSALLDISKIRNCLLHGNGRLDSDRYGIDTQETLHLLNSATHTSLLELINHQEGASKIKINETFLHYCFTQIKNFIKSQNRIE